MTTKKETILATIIIITMILTTAIVLTTDYNFVGERKTSTIKAKYTNDNFYGGTTEHLFIMINGDTVRVSAPQYALNDVGDKYTYLMK